MRLTRALYTFEQASSHVCSSSTLLLVCEDLAFYHERSCLRCLCSLFSFLNYDMYFLFSEITQIVNLGLTIKLILAFVHRQVQKNVRVAVAH